MTRIIYVLLVTMCVAHCAETTVFAEPTKPNIIFVFVDDQGYYDLGCYGATEVKTPRIDALADGGVLLLRRFVVRREPDC